MRNPEDQRQLLAQAVLHVRSGRATSRRTLADLMRLSPTTSGQYADQLIASGHFLETGLDQGPMGRPKRRLSTNPAAGWFAGIEFNAERVQGVRVDFSGVKTGAVLLRLPEDAAAGAIMDEVKRAVTLLAKGAESSLLGIGVGAPGIVDSARGLALEYAFSPDWRDVPVAGQLGKRFDVAVTVENNLRVIALAERWFGGASALSDYVILGPRSGLGIAIMHGGRPLIGTSLAGGELGRWPWPPGAPQGELHDALSSPAVWRKLTGKTKRAALPADLHAALAAHAGDDTDAWNGIVREFALVLTLAQLTLDTHTWFLHGPLTALGTRFCDAILAHAAALSPALRAHPPRLIPSSLGDDAGALGAASMAMEAWLPQQPGQYVSRS